MGQDDVGRALRSQFPAASRVKRTYVSVKFVPRLGPFAVSKLSKKAIASARAWKVAESKPP